MKSYFLFNENHANVKEIIKYLNFETRNSILEADYDIVIPWGVLYDNISESNIILNDGKIIREISDKTKLYLKLAINGISVPLGKNDGKITAVNWKYQELYKVYLFQNKILKVFKLNEINKLSLKQPKNQNSYWITLKLQNVINDQRLKKIINTAIRGIYATGLDFGAVTIGTKNKKNLVINIESFPILNDKIARLFANEFNNFSKKSTDKQDVLIGCDPEFIMLGKKDNLILASDYFSIDGEIGCDAFWINQNRKLKPIVEIRPNPSEDPLNLFHNIKKLIQQAKKNVNNNEIRFLAGSMPLSGYPIGGHIHFSGIPLNFWILRVLDNYLSLPLFLLESSKKDALKRRPKYGFLGDYREKYYGGFEYRTLASWLVDPEIAKGVIILAYIIAHSITYLRNFPLKEYKLQKAFYHGNKELLYPYIIKQWEQLEALNLYKIYEEHLIPIKNKVMHRIEWNEEEDFKEKW